jgi:ribosomal protein S14
MNAKLEKQANKEEQVYYKIIKGIKKNLHLNNKPWNKTQKQGHVWEALEDRLTQIHCGTRQNDCSIHGRYLCYDRHFYFHMCRAVLRVWDFGRKGDAIKMAPNTGSSCTEDLAVLKTKYLHAKLWIPKIGYWAW